MFKAFQQHISTLVGKPEKKKYLLAVSGGIDSVVMAELFQKAGYDFAIAHCNFKLRGKESDGDEKFVNELAHHYKRPFFVEHFDTNAYSKKQKLSIQMAARELRYKWLKEIAAKHKYDFIVIAHHGDDVIETFFINLLRGTGIAGLHGINAEYENILRPLLCFSRKDIEGYAKQLKLKWREDSSNASDKYERNKIRHHLLPLLKELNPNADKAIQNTIENLRQTEKVYLKAVEENMSEISEMRNGRLHISIDGLSSLPHKHLYLYEGIKKYGFNYVQAEEIAGSLERQSGKVFLSQSHRITKDRNHLILDKLPSGKNESIKLSKEVKAFVNDDFAMEISVKSKPKDFKPSRSAKTASLDYEKLKFPLTIRKWAQGDRFYPLGMQKPKKISDFLIDLKVPLAEKDGVYVLLSGKEIAWVIGYRIDERFKIDNGTKKLYICNTEPLE